MHEITKPVFVAEDGTEFLDRDECRNYENLKEVINIISDHTTYTDKIYDVEDLAEAILKWCEDQLTHLEQ